MDKKEAGNLLSKYAEGRCTPEEIGQLHEWYARYERTNPGELPELEGRTQLSRIRKQLTKLSEPNRTLRKTTGWRRVAAAVIALILSGALYFVIRDQAPRPASVSHQISSDLPPGDDRAILTLEDGRKVHLDSTFNGELLSSTGIKLTKTEDGLLIYALLNNATGISQTHRIQTPRRGQFRVLLPDGTTVRLNAASSLEYSTSALPTGERRVRLEGEAYFDVTKNENSNFIVETSAQEIRVLGTRFNVTTYPEESHSRTVLIEGSVRIQAVGSEVPMDLVPGQEAITTGGQTEIRQANTEEAVAWTQGYFMFDDEPIESIMRKIARWYDVGVEFKAVDKNQVFSGTVSRFENVSKVLEKLELTGGVHFELETNGHSGKERRIIVMP